MLPDLWRQKRPPINFATITGRCYTSAAVRSRRLLKKFCSISPWGFRRKGQMKSLRISAVASRKVSETPWYCPSLDELLAKPPRAEKLNRKNKILLRKTL